MTISNEEANQIKEKIISQIKETFPQEKQAESIEKIQSMDSSQLEEFLKQNNMINQDNSNGTQCIFCSIVNEEAQAIKLAQNEKAIAILEINPLSEGHTIVIPKEHLDKVPEEAEKLAQDVKKRLKSALKPRDIIVEHNNMFGHAIINIIPVYGDTISKEKKKADPEQLAKIKEKVLSSPKEPSEKKEEPKPEKKKVITEKDMILPKRIP